MSTTAKTAQIKLTRMSPAYWRITFDNPPLNLMGPEFVLEFREIMTAIETDEQVRVVVFDSAVEGFFLNHSDFNAKLEDLTKHTARAHGAGGVAGHPRAPDACACRVDRPDPRAGDGERKRDRARLRHEFREPGKSDSVAMGSGRRLGRRRRTHGATAAADRPGSRLGSAACVRRHPRRSGAGLWLCEPVAAGRRARRICRALATRIASFDKWAIANTKRLVNANSLPPDVEMAAGWDACMASLARPAAQDRIKALFEQGFHKPGDAEDRLGFYLGRLGR